jgi:hypothetical protein
MKYVSIDTESTGLNPETDQILEVAMLLEDTENPLPLEQLPRFHQYIYRDRIEGDPTAILMNSAVILKIQNLKKASQEERDTWLSYDYNLPLHMGDWLRLVGFKKETPITFAGKNPAFDFSFLNKLPDFKRHVNYKHRMMDPAILFTDFDADDCLPDTALCKLRAGLNPTISHRAVDDAWDVIQLLRKWYGKVQKKTGSN